MALCPVRSGRRRRAGKGPAHRARPLATEPRVEPAGGFDQARDIDIDGLAQRIGHILARHIARRAGGERRSEEHTSELQSLMRISYAVFCLKKKKKTK